MKAACGSAGRVLVVAVLLFSAPLHAKSLAEEDILQLFELLTETKQEQERLDEKSISDEGPALVTRTSAEEGVTIEDCFASGREDLCYPLTPQDEDDLSHVITSTDITELEADYKELTAEIFRITKRSANTGSEVRNAEKRRQKRGIIITGLTVLWRGWVNAQQISEGCASYPSICKEVESIESLNDQIETLLDAYDAIYDPSLTRYNELVALLYDNSYLIYYEDETMQSLASLGGLVDTLLQVLAARLEQLVTQLQGGTVTQDSFVVLVFSPLERILNNTKTMFEESQVTPSSTQAIALKLFLDLTATKYLNTVQHAMSSRGLTLNDGQLGNILYPEQHLSANQRAALYDASADDHEGAVELAAAFVKGGFYNLGITLAATLPLTAECFNEVTHRPFIYLGLDLQNNKDGVFKGRPVESRAKAHYYTEVKPALAAFIALQRDVTSARWNQFSSAGFKHHWSESLVCSTSPLYTKATSSLLWSEWANLRDDLVDLRIIHEHYLGNLTEASKTLDADVKAMEEIYESAEMNFQDMAVAAQQVLQEIIDEESLQLFEGIHAGFTFSPPADLDGHWGDAEARQEKRAEVLGSAGSQTSGCDSAVAMVHARGAYFLQVRDEAAKNRTVAQIYEFVATVLEHSLASEARGFGSSLSEGDILCDLADMYVTAEEFDFYDLRAARTSCNTDSAASFQQLKESAETARLEARMVPWVQVDVNAGNVPVSRTYQSVVAEFTRLNEPGMTDFAAQLREKDIVCVIASVTSDNVTMYDNYEMTPFRELGTDCVNMDDVTWSHLQYQHTRMNSLVERLAPELGFCARHAFCTCWWDLTIRYMASDEELRLAMQQSDGSLTRYCGGSLYHQCSEPVCVDL